jgi:5'(3')-deoxyribonucleotidase
MKTTAVALDLDGVLYEWHRTVRYMMREYQGVMMPDDAWDTWDAHKLYYTPEQERWLWSEGVGLGLFRYGHVVKGAIIGMRALQLSGYRLYVVTHRPRNAVPDTIAWLNLLQKPGVVTFDGVAILSDGQPKSTIEADILVDDKPENIQEWHGHGKRAIIYDQQWNRDFQWQDRAMNWAHLTRMLTGGKR